MSDDKAQTAGEQITPEETPGSSPVKSSLPPAVALAFVIIALLGVIIVMVLKNGSMFSSSSSAEIQRAQAELQVLRQVHNNERIAMGLSPILGDSEPIENIAGRLKKDADSLVALAGSYQKMLEQKDAELAARNAEILRSENLRQSLAAESVRLQNELQRALVSSTDADILRRDLVDLKAQRDALAAELATLREKMLTMTSGPSGEDFADLQRRFDETLRAKEFFEARAKDLEAELAKARLFASSENELLPAAVELFRNLRQLENMPDSEISSAYSSLAVKLGANVVKTLSFATGSSALASTDQDAIRTMVADIPDGDLLLSIGYASETGNVDSNRSLSSDRATAAAQLISSVKRPEQLTQAVYLGQTDRFSSRIPERNQLVEIWHIRKK